MHYRACNLYTYHFLKVAAFSTTQTFNQIKSNQIKSKKPNQITLLTQQKGTGTSWCSTVTQSLYILFNPLRHSIAPMSSLVGSSD